MAAIKRLHAWQTCRSLWVPSPGGCPAQRKASSPQPQQSLLQPCSLSPAFLLLSIQSGGVLDPFLPYTSHWSPPRTPLFAGHCNAKLGYRGLRGPGLISTSVKVTMISEMQKYQGVQDQEAGGKWKCPAFHGGRDRMPPQK